MKSNSNLFSADEMKTRLSILWIFIMFNMAFADIISYSYPGYMAKIVAGTPIDGVTITPMLLLISSIILEIPIAMIFLSRLMKYGINRWVNIIAGVITIVFVLGGGSPILSYIFFATVEVLTCLVIIGIAWKWRVPENQM